MDFDEEANSEAIHRRPRRPIKRRGDCDGVILSGYAQGEGRRNWRAIGIGVLVCHVQSDAPRFNCPTHRPTVAQVPWARPAAPAILGTSTTRATKEPFDRLVRIGIDETSYRRGHHYLSVVVDHDSGGLIWVAVSRDRATLKGVFGRRGEERSL